MRLSGAAGFSIDPDAIWYSADVRLEPAGPRGEATP